MEAPAISRPVLERQVVANEPTPVVSLPGVPTELPNDRTELSSPSLSDKVREADARGASYAATPATPVAVPEEQKVQAALHEYRDAYDRLDAAAAKAVWPTVDVRALSRAFEGLKSQGIVFDRCNVAVHGLMATAACAGSATYVQRVGTQAARTQSREWTFQLRKADEAWVIVSAQTR
jgi:hypothetical protein